MRAFKLFRVMKDGSIASLFINKKDRYPIGEWMNAKAHRTKGYAFRPGWHCCLQPSAPHLSEKNRQWYEVELKGTMLMARPNSQGGTWVLGQKMKIIGPVIT